MRQTSCNAHRRPDGSEWGGTSSSLSIGGSIMIGGGVSEVVEVLEVDDVVLDEVEL